MYVLLSLSRVRVACTLSLFTLRLFLVWQGVHIVFVPHEYNIRFVVVEEEYQWIRDTHLEIYTAKTVV